MYKVYESGQEFYLENKDVLEANILDTSFFIWNSKCINEFTKDNYIIKIYNEDSFLFLMEYSPFNLLLYGDKSLCNEAVDVLRNYNLAFNGILSNKELGISFLESYKAKMSGEYEIKLSMDIMYCNRCIDLFIEDVKKCSDDDLIEVAGLVKDFYAEALKTDKDINEIIEQQKRSINDFYCVKRKGEIVAIAKRTRDEDFICSVSCVYTKPQYRGLGLSKKIVTYITENIIKENKIPYLYVDKSNPISNHLYKSIGYEYGNSKYEIMYKKSSIEVLELAGGCFWCMAKPYYEYDGVIRVLSGYAGGQLINPSYEEVKQGCSGHREAILIEYDSSVITYNKLIDIYFDTIDPFDDGGQFIDRGSNYTCAIFTNNAEVRDYINDKLQALENEYNRKCNVDILSEVVFYMAEEYHQDYAIKNPEEMEKELILSGRKNKSQR